MTEIAGSSEDLRVQRSRALMQQALFALIVEKGFAAVTVRDITQRARVNRSTFYRHYIDKYDLLNQYLDQLQQQVSQLAANAASRNDATPERIPEGLLLLVRHVQAHADFYRIMLGKHGDQSFTLRFRQLSEQRYRPLFARFQENSSADVPPLDLRIAAISSAFVGAIVWWLEQGCPSTAEQFAIWLSQLSMAMAGLSIEQLRQPPN